MQRLRNLASVGVLLLVVLVGIIDSTMADKIPQAPEFFKVESDLTQIMWAHAVNDKMKLEQALNNSGIHMIEADVVLLSNGTAAMGHPPVNETKVDLTLEEFLNKVNSTKDLKKGIKLDMKSTDVVDQTVSEVQKYLENSKNPVPIWMNADVLSGRGEGGEKPQPVDVQKFLTSTSKISQAGALLSLGWTTPSTNCSSGTPYSKGDLAAMREELKKHSVNQSVTYPIRACLALSNNTDVFKELNKTETVTIWSAEHDVVDAEKLSDLINSIGANKVYLDVPEELRKKLNIKSGAGQILLQNPLIFLTAIFAILYSFKM